jgi:hypothetical protein
MPNTPFLRGYFRKARVVNATAAYGVISPEVTGDGLPINWAEAAGRLRRETHTPITKASSAATPIPLAQTHHSITSSYE